VLARVLALSWNLDVRANDAEHRPTLPRSLVSAVSNRDRVTGAPHAFYRYPARFSPVFAREVIEAFTQSGETVLDPFCGGGTSLVEAVSLGRRAVGMDVSSLAAFLTRTKTTPISIHDKREISAWLEFVKAERVSEDAAVSLAEDAEHYLRNLPPTALIFFNWVCALVLLLPRDRQRRFVRMVLLGVGQWGLDCKSSVPSLSEFKTEFVHRLCTALAGFFQFITDVARVNSMPRCRMASLRRVINRSAEACDGDGRIPATWLPAKLLLTSPPYPGVHVVYHRWQIRGRKETPAPFWLTNQRDGAGESHYLLGPRAEPELVTYYKRLKSVFSSARALLDTESMIVQLVAFADPAWQLPAYLRTMEEAGFREVATKCDTAARVRGRIWRAVPGRKWYANRQGSLPASKEVMLLHRVAM
jgi:DNA modification methylase